VTDGYSAFDGVLWRRVVAYFLDLAFVSLLCLPFALFLLISGFVTFGLTWGALPFLWVGMNVLYYALLVSGGKSATWGQRLTGLKSETEEGRSPLFFQALFQIILFYGSLALTTGLILLVGLFNAKGRLIHDYLSGLVVRKSA
jgi:uncharacterized RDD family membrane protein YckC